MFATKKMAILAVLLSLLVPETSVAQAFEIPEEVVLTYYNLLYAEWTSPIGAAFGSPELDPKFCRAYDLLTAQSKEGVSREDYVRALAKMRAGNGLENREIGQAMYNDTRTIAKVMVILTLSGITIGRVKVQRVVTLVKEDAGWRILLSNEQIEAIRQTLRELRQPNRPVNCS